MLTAIVILFFVVILMVCLHLYARWYLVRARRRHSRRHRRRTNLVFYMDSPNPESAATVSAANRGLDASVLKSIPVFVYSSKTHPDMTPDCAVCLSEFEENETGRTLPKCRHSFHIECIDMWFHSHSTCPLCRTSVEPDSVPENPAEFVISVVDPAGNDPGSSSELCSDCQCDEEQTGQASSSIAARRKPMELAGVSIEVPRRNENFRDESGRDSPSGQGGFRSPMSRMLSFTRILSKDRRASPTSDIERGIDETRQTQV
ncbi:hypothetical protein FH972_015425 [Carpinus fangiana]|uniref:RING-type E3 ubiquitin transferase n=1 Tax=Carpinus fangiana TaxID=176857 RepID=A0A5N6RG40_9ROSI|nr:hypothetical protein FH972_015425 [Carpinus fangiana]